MKKTSQCALIAYHDEKDVNMREKKTAERYTQVDKRVCVKREDFISQSRCVVGTWHITQSFFTHSLAMPVSQKKSVNEPTN